MATPARSKDTLTTSKTHPACERDGHQFEPITEADTRTTTSDGGTDISRPFICVKCGDMIEHMVAHWQPRKKNSGNYKDTDGDRENF